MTRLFWVRHGPTHARGMTGWTDLPADLSDAAALARLDAYLPRPALLLSSDLRRAVSTADALAGGRQRLAPDPGLREIHFGAWETLTHDAVAATDPDRLRAFWDDPGDTHPPGGESWNALAARVTAATDRVLAGHAGRDVVIVCHFGAILSAYQRAQGIAARAAFGQRIDPLSVTELTLGPDGWHCGAVNHRP